MRRRRLVATAAACAILQPCAALETAPLPARDLHAACVEYADAPESEKGRMCEIYVRGFIAGLKATGSAQLDDAERGLETFSERALRTRLGVQAARRACPREPLSVHALVARLLAYAAATPEAQDGSAGEMLAGVLKRFPDCG